MPTTTTIIPPENKAKTNGYFRFFKQIENEPAEMKTVIFDFSNR